MLPALSEFYYALEAAFLPAIVFLQWRLGSRRLRVADADSVAANALFVSASCFVLPDCMLLLFGRPDLLSLWARAAGPLALFCLVWVLHRGTRSWKVTVSAAFVMTLPALFFVR